MQIGDFIKPSEKFLKGTDIIENPKAKFVIISEGDIIISSKFGNERLQLDGEFDKKPKTFDCGKVNARFIAKRLGKDTKAWVGKVLILETYKTKTSEGKMTDAINIKDVEGFEDFEEEEESETESEKTKTTK